MYIGVVKRIIEILVFIYIVFYVFIYQRGYQSSENGLYSNLIKLKGAIKNKNNFYEILDLLYPNIENEAFFIKTSFINYDKQNLAKCTDSNTLCNTNLNCTRGLFDSKYLGFQTGMCISDDDKNKLCESEGWCSNQIILELEKTFIFSEIDQFKNFTIFIKSYVSYPVFNYNFDNLPNNENKDFLKKCGYDPNNSLNKTCPIFYISDIIKATGSDFKNIIEKGGVISININWECDLDWIRIKSCKPTYSFSKLHTNNDISPGFNFYIVKRRYKENNKNYRDVQKLYGIKFIIKSNAIAYKFDMMMFTINLASGIGMLGIVSIICDWFLLNFTSHKNKYIDNIFIKAEEKIVDNRKLDIKKDISEESEENFIDQTRKNVK